MERVMIVGQPGSGKSTLARVLGQKTGLPVVHMDRIHWKPGWIPRPDSEKDALVASEIARERWIFEGGHSRSYADRIARANLVIWLDLPLVTRLIRVIRRTAHGHGTTRPDLPPDCPELWRNMPEFLWFILRTHASARSRIARALASVPPSKLIRLHSGRCVDEWLTTFGEHRD